MVLRLMAQFSLPALLRAGEQEARMTVAARTTAGTIPSDTGRPDRRREVAAMGQKEAVWLARYVCFLSLVFAGLGLLLLVLGREHHGAPVFGQWAEDAVVAVGFSTLGAVVAPRFPPGNPIGWLFCAIGLVGAVLLFCGEYATYALLVRPGSLPGGEGMAWIASWLWVAHIGLFVFLALLFPDGRPPSPRWRPFAWLVGVAVVVGTVAAAFPPRPVRGLGAGPKPFGMEGIPNLTGAVEALV